MKLRYQLGAVGEPFIDAPKAARFATEDEAIAVAAWRMSQGLDTPPLFVIDRATRKLCRPADLVRVCGILAGKQVAAGDIPTFIDTEGHAHMGIRA